MKVDWLEQSTASKVSGVEMCAYSSADILAPLMECVLKIEVSIPALKRTDLIHLAIVGLDAGPCGFVDVRNTARFVASEFLNPFVLTICVCRVEAGQ